MFKFWPEGELSLDLVYLSLVHAYMLGLYNKLGHLLPHLFVQYRLVPIIRHYAGRMPDENNSNFHIHTVHLDIIKVFIHQLMHK